MSSFGTPPSDVPDYGTPDDARVRTDDAPTVEDAAPAALAAAPANIYGTVSSPSHITSRLEVPKVEPQDDVPVPDVRCIACDSDQMEPGFLSDSGQYALGDTQWIPGEVERRFGGVAVIRGRDRFHVVVLRCAQCARLDLFALNRADRG